MTEPLRAEEMPAGLGEETEEVIVEVFHKDQGLSPKVDFHFFKQVVFFHLNKMKKPEVNLMGNADKPLSKPGPTRCRRGMLPPPPERRAHSQLSTPGYSHTTCRLEGHLLFFTRTSLPERNFSPRLNMTFDKDVLVIPRQDILGAWC